MAYFENSSIHGFSTIYQSKTKLEKLFWVIMLLLFTTMLGLLINDNVSRYLKHEIKETITYDIQKTPMEFPAVTLCNANRYLSYKVDELANQYFPNDTYDNDNYSEYMTLVRAVSWERTLTMRQSLANFFSPGIFKFNGISLNPNRSVVTTLTDGSCFTFNLNHESVNQLMPGSKQALEIVLYIDQDSYFTNDFYLNTQPAGVHVMIHNREHEPNIKKVVVASPHHVTDIAVERITTKRLPNPFNDNCLMSSQQTKINFPLITNFNYTIDVCRKSCYIFELNKTCGAVDEDSYWAAMLVNIYYPLPNENEETKTCFTKFRARFYTDMSICKCHRLCKETKYQLDVHRSSWPPKVAIPFWIGRMSQKLGRNVSESNIYENLVAVKIYYRQFLIKNIVHSASFTKSMFVADLGGFMGLLLGASVFSIIELYSFINKTMIDNFRKYFCNPNEKNKSEL